MIINRGTSIDEIAKRLAGKDNDSGTPPDKEIKEPEKQDPDKKVKSGDHGLVYAVDINYKNHSDIYLFVDGKNDILIGQRADDVSGLCEYKGKLYDGGGGNTVDDNTIRETLTKKTALADEEAIRDMCSHQGNLLYLKGTGITNVFTGEEIRLNGNSWGLCSHEGELYTSEDDGSIYHVVRNPSSRIKVRVKDSPINALCSHDGKLYCGDAASNVFEIDGGIISTGGKAAIFSLCSHNGILYAGTNNSILPKLEGEIYEVSTGEALLRANGGINAMCSVSPGIVNQIMKMKK